jgi:signal peptide peptidase SppA
MKQLPHISGLLYGTPWAIIPESHAELGMLYRSYLAGNLPVPQNLDGQARVSSGVSYSSLPSVGIAIIHLEGIISKRTPDMLCGPQIVDLAKLDALLDEVAADTLIDTLVIDLNSPGGVVIGLQETAERMRELATQGIRLIAYTDYLMASAAYYLAAACDEIYCAPSSRIGSIGTYCAGVDDSRAWEMDGLELVLGKSGNFKAMGHPGKAWTAEEKEFMQKSADKEGEDFRAWVASRRPGVTEAAMQGQCIKAQDADPALYDGFYRDLPALLAHLTNSI